MIRTLYQTDHKTLPGVGPIVRGSGVGRTPGTHLTDIIRHISRTLNRQKAGPEGWSSVLSMEAGFIWEDTLSYVLGSRLGVRLGEVEKDGVLMSPDGFGFVEKDVHEGPVLEEYKLTWRSLKNPVEKEWEWMVQTMAYCWALGLSAVLFHVLYLMGDYRGSGPVYRETLIRFERQDMLDNWRMILKHKRETEEWIALVSKPATEEEESNG